MRKFSIILVSMVLSITGFGQDVIINFAGEGAATEVTTVEVVNLSNCTSIEMPGWSSLNLTTGVIIAVEEFEHLESKNTVSYPNPFSNSTSIEFYVSQADFVSVTVCDVAGKIVADYGKELTAGVHSFEFTAHNLGVYFINVSGTDLVGSSKVICMSNNSQQAQLVYNEQIAEAETEKSYKKVDSKEDFYFSEGDILKIKGISGDYATVMVVEPTVSATYILNFVECTDSDANNYAVVEIGSQIWMAENIKTTSYTNGDAIPLVTGDTEWANLGDNDTDKAYCFYDNDVNGIYGALYTYAAATNGDNSGVDIPGVCPTGWHLPNDDEWTALTDELGGESVAGGKLKSTCMELWNTPNTGATNESGFTALPGGLRDYYDGSFNYDDIVVVFWSATQYDDTEAWWRNLSYDYAGSDRYYDNKSGGLYVRCVKD
ncbi:MAG: hypothetical protein B7C24_11555 [Bacteroidetes bacterium 4572_77]|nr:MAG: hypothetical protein B7C24_11555 [Bacteroidetes bacterium 4572_77]